LKQDTWHFLF